MAPRSCADRLRLANRVTEPAMRFDPQLQVLRALAYRLVHAHLGMLRSSDPLTKMSLDVS